MNFSHRFSQAYERISSLPIFPHLDEICDALKSSKSRFLVLTAETAAGKSTGVPLALLERFDGKILMLEPRRLAAVAIAERLSDLLGENVGETVGFALHLNSKISSKTRLEVITEAILTRRIQSDPFLEGVNVIILDEFHERSIYSDLALAFLKETMQLREDLFVIVMSATINYRSLSEYLGVPENPAPVLQIQGRKFPVDITYRANVSVAKAIFDELTNERSEVKSSSDIRNDTILAFLPGIFEIKKAKSELENYLSLGRFDVEILILHSSVPISEQRKILRPCQIDSPRRIILSSAIAETSLTVPGVTLVVDSGLCRMNKMNVALGMEHLVTENESRFSAEQRAGRAGRVAAGKCIRLWSEYDVRTEQNPPEILRADLTQLVLECVQWGAGEREKLDWLTSPSEAGWNAARLLLENLGCIEMQTDSNGMTSTKITETGKSVLRLGLHPRLACVALAGGAESVLPFSEYAEAGAERQKIFLNDLRRRLNAVNALSERGEKGGRENPAYRKILRADFLFAGFPDRLAKKSLESQPNAERAEYQFPSGRKAFLSRELLVLNGKSPEFPNWLIAPEVDAGERTGKIYSFEPISDEQAEIFLQKHATAYIKTEFIGLTNGSDFRNISIQKREITAYGAIIQKEKKLAVSSDDFALALCDFVRQKGINSLPLDIKIEDFLLRIAFFIQQAEDLGDSPNLKKAFSDLNTNEIRKKYENLSQTVENWLRPFVHSQKINSQIVFDALYWYLDGAKIDEFVPTQIILPNGRKRKVRYEKKTDASIQPALEIIIQQIFGCFETPKILGKSVLLKLLSPASRPLQITEDLEHFWQTSWLEICKEMKGRYPKHNWDYRKPI